MGLITKFAEKGNMAGFVAKAIARTLQFALAVAVAGLYGYRLSADQASGQETPHKWLYAEAVAGLSAITTIVFMLPFVKTHALFAWDLILFILWTVLFGIFASIFLKRTDAEPYESQSLVRMKSAMWLDMINMVLWFITGVYGGVLFWIARKTKSVTSKSVV